MVQLTTDHPRPGTSPQAEPILHKLEELAEESVFPVMIVDENRQVYRTNQAFSDLCGHPIEDLRGKQLSQILHGRDTGGDTVERMRNKLNERLSFAFRILNYHRDGFPYIAGGVIIPFLTEDGRAFYVAVERELYDFTENIESMGFSQVVVKILSVLSA